MERGVCSWCDEPVLPEDHAVRITRMDADGAMTPAWMHRECINRSVSGGLNHLRKECRCFKGDAGLDPDPPGMSKRDAARAVLAHWLSIWGE